MQADRAVNSIVGNDDNEGIALHGGGDFCPFIRKSPSPAIQTTGRFGWSLFIATAAGTP
jgi:hypothetical protein